MKNLENIISAINDLRDDIKAEVIIADIIENEVDYSDLVAVHQGTFKRQFKHDISHADLKKLDNDLSILEIYLTRDGIYDSLPEGLFHDQATESANSDISSISKKQRREEKEARKLFLPFENELFYQRIALEMEERKILNRFNKNLFDDIIPEFWKLDKTLPQKYLSRLVLLLHFAHKIVGNNELTAKTLEVILEEKVQANIVSSSVSSNNLFNNNNTRLGQSKLGSDFVIEQADYCYPTLQFKIGPLCNSPIGNYLENAPGMRFLQCFYNFFAPMNMHTSTIILVNKDDLKFTLNADKTKTILGYNTAI